VRRKDTGVRKVRSWYLPDTEAHMILAIEADDSYQAPHRKHALGFCHNFKVAIDIGAHIGLWARDLSFHFKKVMCFEPVDEFREILRKNLENCSNVEIFPFALGNKTATVSFNVEKKNTGNSHVDPRGTSPHKVQMRTLDSFAVERVDFIKMDCEGYEVEVIKGAEETLKRCRPIINLEQKTFLPNGGKQYDAVRLLESYGARQKGRKVDEIVMGWY
jgi:FkbM family methyltransferase